MLYEPLTRDEIVRVIEGKGKASRVPVLLHMWTHANEFGERQPQVDKLLEDYPMDVQLCGFVMPDTFIGREDDPEYRWVNFDDTDSESDKALDEKVIIEDWAQLDGIIKTFPSGDYPGMFPWKPVDDQRYKLGCWWYWMFERQWSLRGMTNALTDPAFYPDETHRLFRAMTDFYKRVIERSATELKLDGMFTSDDLGTQRGPFFSLDTFREFYKPYYKEVIDTAHDNGMHFWLHTCGNIELFMEDFIEIGLDVIHPIQKYTMDEKAIAGRYQDRICIWSGFDVQQTIPWGTPEEVRKEVRFLLDTYDRTDGKLMLTAGNGINGDCPVPSLEALFEEAFKFGLEVCKRR